jgi:hypothetical protein
MAAWRGRGLRFGAAEARWESRSAWAVTRRAIERHVRVVPGLGRASWPDDERPDLRALGRRLALQLPADEARRTKACIQNRQGERYKGGPGG